MCSVFLLHLCERGATTTDLPLPSITSSTRYLKCVETSSTNGLDIVLSIIEEVHILFADWHSLTLVPTDDTLDAGRFVATTKNNRRIDIVWIAPLIWERRVTSDKFAQEDVLHVHPACSAMRYNS
jgi:hypothetical protein